MTEPVPGARRALGAMLAAARRSARAGRGARPGEVAERAGVGESWYRWLEEGRNIGLSPVALGWVADALALRGPARERLFGLAGLEEADELSPIVEPMRPSVRDFIEAVDPYPAYLYGRRGDILAWNGGTEAVYRCHLFPPLRRNTYLFIFAQPEIRKLIVNWKEQATRQILELKSTIAASPQDPALAELRRLLEAESPDFRALWRAKPSAPPPVKVFLHPRVGRLVFDVESLSIEGEPRTRGRFYLPRSRDGTRGRLAQLLDLHRRDSRNGRQRVLRETVRKVKEHIDRAYARAIPLDELAALADMDKFRLLRAFSSEVGFPPHAYQLLVRIFHARRMLSAGDSAALPRFRPAS